MLTSRVLRGQRMGELIDLVMEAVGDKFGGHLIDGEERLGELGQKCSVAS